MTREKRDTSCCHALQDKVRAADPSWELLGVYAVKRDTGDLTPPADSTCCQPTAQYLQAPTREC